MAYYDISSNQHIHNGYFTLNGWTVYSHTPSSSANKVHAAGRGVILLIIVKIWISIVLNTSTFQSRNVKIGYMSFPWILLLVPLKVFCSEMSIWNPPVYNRSSSSLVIEPPIIIGTWPARVFEKYHYIQVGDRTSTINYFMNLGNEKNMICYLSCG